jgi:hypothetical protein
VPNFCLAAKLRRSANIWGMKTTSCPFPLLESLRVSFRSFTWAGIHFRTFPLLIPPSGHQFQNKSISWLDRPENDVIPPPERDFWDFVSQGGFVYDKF